MLRRVGLSCLCCPLRSPVAWEQMEFNRRVAVKLGNDATLLSPSVTSLGLRLSVLQLEWCRRVCAGSLTPATSTGASASASDAPVDPRVHFPAVPGDAARLLPESLLTSSLDYIGFVGHHSVTTFTEVAHDVVEALLVGTVAFLRNPGYVHSPHLRASFGTVSCCRHWRLGLCLDWGAVAGPVVEALGLLLVFDGSWSWRKVVQTWRLCLCG